jgi:phosphomannomutase
MGFPYNLKNIWFFITLCIKSQKVLKCNNYMVKPTHTINPSALRAYDIRGGIGEILEIEDAYYIGKAYVTKIIRKYNNPNPTIALGYDGRVTSEEMQQLCLKGLVDAGAKVICAGLGPSPQLYYTVRSMELDGGIMVTGSHNPSHHNGFKMMYKKDPLFGDDIQDIGRICIEGDFETSDKGSFERVDIQDSYIERMLRDLTCIKTKAGKDFLSNMKICWDPGNGAAGVVTKKLIAKLPGKHFIINENIDGTFPAHHPDPTVAENLQQLIELVKKTDANLGIAFDGDGDRIGAVDGRGRIIWGDQMMTIYSEDVLESNPGSTIIADVKASQTFFDRVKELGGKPLMWKTGHSYIKNKLAETGAPLAGEMSGHIFFADKYYGFDDAVYSAVRLINYFARKQLKPSVAVDMLPESFASSEYRIQVPEQDKARIVAEVKAKVVSSGAEINEIDGIRVKESQGGWWLLRQSNTQSVITIRAEATSEDRLEKIKNKLREFLKPYNIDKEI